MFTATVTFANGTDDTRTGVMPEITTWLAAHNPAIVTGVIMVRAAEPKATAPKATAPKATAPRAAPRPAAKTTARPYAVKSTPLPDTAAGRRLAALRARHAAA